MLRWRLDPELHGGAGYTSVTRIAAFGLVIGFFVLGSHIATQAWYNGRMLPGVVVAGRDVGGLTTQQARALIQKDVAAYRLRLQVGTDSYELPASALGVTFDTEATLASAYSSGRTSWLPPLHHDPIALAYHLSRAQLNTFVASVADKIGTPPVDASVVVSGGQVSTIPEKSGWSIDKGGLERLIEDNVRTVGSTTLSVSPRETVADIQVKALAPTIAEAKSLMAVPIVLSYQDRNFTPTSVQIGQWLAFLKQPAGLGF